MSESRRQVRHKPPSELRQPRPLIVALPEMHSNVNLSRIVRAAGCFGVRRVIACGKANVDPKIARDAVEQVAIEARRSLPSPLGKLKRDGFAILGLEQTNDSRCLFDFAFPHRSVIVVGHERRGLDDDVLAVLDEALEIPVYGRPFSFNAATAAVMAMYEYCRQHRD